jgi:hypothetical protein
MSRTATRTRRTASIVATTGLLAALATVVGVSGPALAAGGTTDDAVTTTAVDPNDALLRAGQMPVVNDVQDWKRVPVRHSRVSTAQPDALSSLGYAGRARRDFSIPGGRATNVVLTFADPAAAKDAYAEVKAWRQHTGDNIPVGGQLLFTGQNTPVDVQQGRGSFLPFVFKADRNADEGTFEWVGVTRRGATVSIIDWRVNGQDATYEVDPTIASVQAANVKLGRLA